MSIVSQEPHSSIQKKIAASHAQLAFQMSYLSNTSDGKSGAHM